MDWRREEADVVEQILMLLGLLAGLADRAVGLPVCLALPVLALLARGETVARSFIAGLPSGAPAIVATSHASDRAERLAADFRALARLLRTLLSRARRRERLACTAGRRPRRISGSVAFASHAVAAAAAAAAAMLPAPDTS